MVDAQVVLEDAESKLKRVDIKLAIVLKLDLSTMANVFIIKHYKFIQIKLLDIL